MSRQGWSPVLEARLRALALAAARDIGTTVAATAEKLPPSLASGDAGVAVLFAYLEQAFPGEGFGDQALGRLERAVSALATQRLGPSLSDGFTGIAWAATHVRRRLGYADDLDGADPGHEIDRALERLLAPRTPGAHGTRQQPCELLYGLAGLGIYHLGRDPRPTARAGLAHIVERLDESAIATGKGLAWPQAPWRSRSADRTAEDAETTFDLGLAHGVAGPVAFLAHALARGITPERTRRTLERACAWLLGQQNPEGSATAFGSFTATDGRAATSCRTAWCYGDPGIAAALLAAARALGSRTLEQSALDVALLAARRPCAQTGVVDAGLCHGAAGLGQVFARFFDATGDERFRVAAARWIEHALRLRSPGGGIAGFRTWVGEEDGEGGWSDEPGLLNGAAGIGLALLAAALPIAPAWDIVLLVQHPSVRSAS